MSTERVEDDATERAIELARELPLEVALPPTAGREEMRTAILAAAARRAPIHSSHVRRYALGGIVLAAAATVAIVLAARSEPTRAIAPIAAIEHRGTVHAMSGARFTSSTLPDEIVRLSDGTIAIDVDPLAPGERFRVVVGDGEIEVRGTAFEVVASDDHLLAVTVAHGRVEVRPIGGVITVLGAGESWHRTVTARIDVPAPIVVPSPPSPPTRAPLRMTTLQPKPAIAPIARTPDAIALDEAWSAMRTSKFSAAATAFARVVAIAPDGSLADDARYWAAVAHSRAGERDAAIVAFRELVDRHPTSAHVDEASVMLGWLLLETNALDEARRRFVAGAGATASEVRDSARAGLESLDKPQ